MPLSRSATFEGKLSSAPTIAKAKRPISPGLVTNGKRQPAKSEYKVKASSKSPQPIPPTSQTHKKRSPSDDESSGKRKKYDELFEAESKQPHSSSSSDSAVVPPNSGRFVSAMIGDSVEFMKSPQDAREVESHSGIYGSGIGPNNLRRPILLMRAIDHVSELIPFHRIVASLNQRQTTDTVSFSYFFSLFLFFICGCVFII